MIRNQLAKEAISSSARVSNSEGGMSKALACALLLVFSNAAKSSDSVERGLASWYGFNHHGRRTASGETFNKDGFTAAHRSLKFGTWVRVTHNESGQSIVVRINDRGPYKGGRIIDLSEAAARAIGLKGIAEVFVLAIPPVLTRPEGASAFPPTDDEEAAGGGS
jgi:rare lipoprotein A